MPGRTFVRLILSCILVSVRSNVFVRRGGFRDHLCKSIVSKKCFKFFMKGGVWASRFNFFLQPIEAGEIVITTYDEVSVVSRSNYSLVVSIVNIIYRHLGGRG